VLNEIKHRTPIPRRTVDGLDILILYHHRWEGYIRIPLRHSVRATMRVLRWLSRFDSPPILVFSAQLSVFHRLSSNMRAQRPNAQEREKLRRQRSETRLVVAGCNDLGSRFFDFKIQVTNIAIRPFCRFRVCGQSSSMAESRISQENPSGLERRLL